MKKLISLGFVFSFFMFLNSCAQVETYDYSNLLKSNPKSILVVMPTDLSNDIKAGPAVLSSAVLPLSEKGYYVFPVGMVNDTFVHNGVNEPQEIRNIPLAKIKEVYDADAILYLDIHTYSTQYALVDSVTTVSVSAKLVDTTSGLTLWDCPEISINNADNNYSLSSLIGAIVKHVLSNVVDVPFDVARQQAYVMYGNNLALYTGGKQVSLLYGPKSKYYRKDPSLKFYNDNKKK